MYQHQVDMSKYQLDVALRFDLTRCLDGQPLQFMIKDRCVPRSVSSCSCRLYFIKCDTRSMEVLCF